MTEELRTAEDNDKTEGFSVVLHPARVSYYFPEITRGHAMLWLLTTYHSAECQKVSAGTAGLGIRFG